MLKKMWVVGALKQTIGISMNNLVYDTPCSWADGMVGAFPAFWDKELAEAYAGGSYAVIEFEVEVPERQ